jgi:hypothetical protein
VASFSTSASPSFFFLHLSPSHRLCLSISLSLHKWASHADAQAKLKLLQRERWIDQDTAALAIDFSLYNTNTRYLTIVRIVFEFQVSGNLIRSYVDHFRPNGSKRLTSVNICTNVPLVCEVFLQKKTDGQRVATGGDKYPSRIVNFISHCGPSFAPSPLLCLISHSFSSHPGIRSVRLR